MCCVETVVFSMLFDPNLKVPSTKRGIQVKEKEKKKVVTPWSAAALGKLKEEAKAAAKKKDKDKAPVPPVPVWAPTIPKAKSLSVAPLGEVSVCSSLYSSEYNWIA